MVKLADIGQPAIDAAARKLYPGAAPVNRQVHTPISAVLKHAAKRHLCEERTIERPPQPKGRVRWITPDEAERLLDGCAPHLRPIAMFLLYTGARVSEALELDWRELNLGRAHVTFPKTKNGDARGVPLHSRLVAELANLPPRNSTSRVFTRPDGEPYRDLERKAGGQLKTGWKGACRRAGIADFSPHDCRHTWASWHYQANRDLVSLMELGGWKSERMVLRYAHANVAHRAASIEALPGGNPGSGLAAEKNSQHKQGVV